jgi:hypothetical protein
MAETWLLCTACRTDIPFGAKYFQCSVSTCNRARMRLVFCSVPCWDSHVADARHRDAWAEDKIAPTKAAWEREQASEPRQPVGTPPAPRPASPAPIVRPASSISASPASTAAASSAPSPSTGASTTASATAPARRIVGEPSPAPSPAAVPGVHLNDIVDRDVLIVISKLKKYIKDRSGMNCSDAVAEVLSDHVRALCDDSIRAAGRDERKTVLDRDVPRPRR